MTEAKSTLHLPHRAIPDLEHPSICTVCRQPIDEVGDLEFCHREPVQPQLPPRPQPIEDGNGNKTHYTADDVNAYMNVLEIENESLKAQLEKWESRVSPDALSTQLQHGMNCGVMGFDGYDRDHCTCGLTYRIQAQTEQNLRTAWTKRAEEAEAERDKALEVIREFYGRTGIIDNGKCAICRHGYRSWKLPACKVPSGPCSNKYCLSRKADALLSREPKELVDA